MWKDLNRRGLRSILKGGCQPWLEVRKLNGGGDGRTLNRIRTGTDDRKRNASWCRDCRLAEEWAGGEKAERQLECWERLGWKDGEWKVPNPGEGSPGLW